jgi:hypothetical protein
VLELEREKELTTLVVDTEWWKLPYVASRQPRSLLRGGGEGEKAEDSKESGNFTQQSVPFLSS